jgi:hypothetical protein
MAVDGAVDMAVGGTTATTWTGSVRTEAQECGRASTVPEPRTPARADARALLIIVGPSSPGSELGRRPVSGLDARKFPERRRTVRGARCDGQRI